MSKHKECLQSKTSKVFNTSSFKKKKQEGELKLNLENEELETQRDPVKDNQDIRNLIETEEKFAVF